MRSRMQTAMNFIKCCVGAGSFSLPYAFIQGGLVASVLLCLAIGSLAAYTIVLLGWIEEHAWSQLTHRQQQQQMARHAGHKGLSYPAIGRIVAPHWTCSRQQRSSSHARPGEPSVTAAGPNSQHFQKLAAETEDRRGPNNDLTVLTSVVQPLHAQPCNIMSSAIATAIVLTSVGVGAAYLDFIASTLVSIFPASGWTQTHFMLLTLVPVLPLALVSSYKYLAFTSVLGDIAVAAGIIVVVLFGALGQDNAVDSTTAGGAATNGTLAPPAPLSPGDWEGEGAPLFDPLGVFQVVGSVAFLFAVHIVVLPVVQSMKQRSAFGAVVYSSMLGVAITNTAFGVACALLFASLTQPNVIDNLDDGPVSTTVKVLLCVDLLFTIPMVLAAGRQVLERAVMSRYRHERSLRKALQHTAAAAAVQHTQPGAVQPSRGATHGAAGGAAPPQPHTEHASQALMSDQGNTHPTTAAAQAHDSSTAPNTQVAAHIAPPPAPTETAPLRSGGAGAGALAPKCGREALITSVLRLSLVLVMAAAAITIPNFEMMVTLVGGLVNSFTGFVFPPLLFLALTRNSPSYSPSKCSVVSHIAIAVFGLMAAVLTTTFTIREMAK